MRTVATAHARRVAAIFLSEVERESQEDRRAEFGVRRPTAILIQTLLSAHDGDREGGRWREAGSIASGGGRDVGGMNRLSERAEVRLREHKFPNNDMFVADS